MEEERGNITKLFMIVVIILLIIAICGIFYLIINGKERDYLTKPPKENVEEKNDAKAKYDSIEDVISTLDYSKVNNQISNEIIWIDGYSDDSMLVNASTGKLILKSVDYFIWYGNFGVAEDEENYYIIGKKGEILYRTTDDLEFFPASKLWSYWPNEGAYIYTSKGELFDELDTYSIDEDGLYFYSVSDKLKIFDYNKRLIYEKKIGKDNDVTVFGSSSYLDQNYAVINIEDDEEKIESAIINLKEGNIVYDYVDEYIAWENDNLFKLDDTYLFINNDKVALKTDKKIKEYSINDKYVNINDDIYDLSNMELVKDLVYIPDYYEDNIIQKENDLEITACLKGLTIKYGLKYKGDEYLACKYDDISYYDYNLHKELVKSNKLYVLVEDEEGIFIYDVYNKKKFKDVDTYGIIINTYENEDSYFFNILNGESVNNKNGEELVLADDNYYILSDEDETYYSYYDTNFKKFYEIKQK